MASIKRMAQFPAQLAESSSGFWSTNEKINQSTDEMEAKDDNHPDQLFDAIESFVGDGVDEHPNPKNARRYSESPNKNNQQ
jgi:hypothetical protein